MTWKEIENKVKEDLNIPLKRAKLLVLESRKQYKGFQYAVDNVETSYTDEGFVQIKYFIGEAVKTTIITKLTTNGKD